MYSNIFHSIYRIEKTDNGYIPHRFTERQLEYHASIKDTRKMRALASSSVSMEFYTASDIISFDYKADYHSSVPFVGFDIYENDIYCNHIDYCGNMEETQKVCEGHIEYKKILSGTVKIQIYCSNLSRFEIMNIDIGQYIPVDCGNQRKILFYGDSITQGMSSPVPSYIYPTLVTRALGAQCLNRGVCGDKYNKNGLDPLDTYEPNIIFIAYGINDLNQQSHELPLILNNAYEYLYELKKLYSNIPVNVITPTWFNKREKDPEFKRIFDDYSTVLTSIASDFGFNAIDGLSLIPHVAGFYYDSVVHPNALGASSYAQNLLKVIKH